MKPPASTEEIRTKQFSGESTAAHGPTAIARAARRRFPGAFLTMVSRTGWRMLERRSGPAARASSSKSSRPSVRITICLHSPYA